MVARIWEEKKATSSWLLTWRNIVLFENRSALDAKKNTTTPLGWTHHFDDHDRVVVWDTSLWRRCVDTDWFMQRFYRGQRSFLVDNTGSGYLHDPEETKEFSQNRKKQIPNSAVKRVTETDEKDVFAISLRHYISTLINQIYWTRWREETWHEWISFRRSSSADLCSWRQYRELEFLWITFFWRKMWLKLDLQRCQKESDTHGSVWRYIEMGRHLAYQIREGWTHVLSPIGIGHLRGHSGNKTEQFCKWRVHEIYVYSWKGSKPIACIGHTCLFRSLVWKDDFGTSQIFDRSGVRLSLLIDQCRLHCLSHLVTSWLTDLWWSSPYPCLISGVRNRRSMMCVIMRFVEGLWVKRHSSTDLMTHGIWDLTAWITKHIIHDKFWICRALRNVVLLWRIAKLLDTAI